MNASGQPYASDPGYGAHDEWAVSGGAADARALAGGVAPMIADASRRLQTVSQRLRGFLQQKLKQFEAVSRQCESIVTQRESLMRLQQEVLRDKQEWEQRRLGQIEELRGEQDRLIEAWQKLEDEQRQSLSRPASPQPPGHGPSDETDALMPSFAAAPPPTFSVSPSPSFPAAAATRGPASPFASKSGTVFAEPKFHHGPAAVSVSREAALDQFQRLKREVQKHVQRHQEPFHTNGNGNGHH
jgi:hypothetical protein